MQTSKRRPITPSRVLRAFERLPNALEKAGYAAGLMKPDPDLVPDFLVIGFRKSGTTWLHENLHAHPDVYVGDRKGFRYFDRHFTDSVSDYLERFREAGGRVKGDVSPSYVAIPEVRLQFLRRLMPRVKLVLLLRNPVEREWARVMHDFRKAGRAPDTIPEEQILASLERSGIREIGGFAKLVVRWQRAFSPEQLFVGLFDDITRRPQGLLADVFEHIGVTRDVDWDAFPYADVIIPPFLPELRDRAGGRGTSKHGYRASTAWFPEKYRARLRHLYADDLRTLRDMLGERVAHWDVPAEAESEPSFHVPTNPLPFR